MSHKFSCTLKAVALSTASSLILISCALVPDRYSASVLTPSNPISFSQTISGNLTKELVIEFDNPEDYAGLSIKSDGVLLADNLNIAHAGRQTLKVLVRFEKLGRADIQLFSDHADLIIHKLSIHDVGDLNIPIYADISEAAGIDKVSSIKYGGPTIADMDNDGDYDFIVNNHNAEASKLYWNNGDGTVTKHDKDLARWFMHDLHGTAAGDYDNDGDLDLVVTQGGGNGTDPSKANFYKNSDGKFVLTTGDVKIQRGGRGRGARWSDMDMDGDLDLILLNELGLAGEKPQQFFYENIGNGEFEYRQVEGLQDVEPSRALITDLNQDNIDDIILYSPLSAWLGNGDFTFTEITSQFPAEITKYKQIMGATDIDIDNDGDLDIYLARGKEFEHGKGETPSFDHNPITQELSIKPRGYIGVDQFNFTASGTIKLHDYYFLRQGAFRGQDYPIFLGASKTPTVVSSGEDFEFTADQAQGWPENIDNNGVYFGHIGDGQWKAALVRNGNIFWGYHFSLSGIEAATPEFTPQNRNETDILLRNDGGIFTDVSKEWGIPSGGNALGVTTGDFNNDSHQDLFVYRWGLIGHRISDYMLLNTGQSGFKLTTMHGASDTGGPGNGDMGQAFDFDLDGDLDLLNGSEGGEWYLYENTQPGHGNFAIVKVGYSPKDNIDPISAEIILKTPTNEYRKRVGSAGEIFSQSLLNIVHFGLGKEEEIEKIIVTWRNGETAVFEGKKANTTFNTDQVDPSSITLTPEIFELREGTTTTLKTAIAPENADTHLIWSSSDETILSVTENGKVTAHGPIGETATITVTSTANALSATSQGKISKWFAVPPEAVKLNADTLDLIIGKAKLVSSEILPANSDDQKLIWSSSNPDIATVDDIGLITGLSEGETTITATSSTNPNLNDSVKVNVSPFIAPYIRFVNEAELSTREYKVGDSIDIEVEYHAGTGNTVISSDEGGIRYWLRHFKSKWIPEKDIQLIDASALKTVSGTSKMSIPLDIGTITSDNLPEGHFYQLRASFASSDGSMNDVGLFTIKIVDAES